MTANHAPGCPTIADPRDGCSCLLRQTSVPGTPRNLAPVDPARPTSVVPAGEDYGAPIEPPDESVAVFCDTDGDLIPMKRFDDYWYGRDPDDRGTWVQCVAQLGKPIAVHVPGASRIAVAAQGEHDRMCPVYVPMPENQCGYCHLIARVREDERANLYTMGQLADRCEESYEEGRKEGYARGLIEGDSGGRREGYRIGYDTAWSLSAAEIERQTLDAARDAVAAHIRADLTGQEMFCGRKSDLIAALRAREEKP